MHLRTNVLKQKFVYCLPPHPPLPRMGREEEDHKTTDFIMLGSCRSYCYGTVIISVNTFVVVVFIFSFPSEYNWILEHIHVVIEVVLVT